MKGKLLKVGTCSLTGETAAYVDSHLLPKALTRPKYPGSPFMESTRGTGFKRQWKSWTDNNLVSRRGEDILAKLDDAGIKELRQKQLIWSSWIVGPPHFDRILPLLPNHAIRKICFKYPAVLWKFVISLLWRSAASQNYAVKNIVLPEHRLDALKQYALGNKPSDFLDFPVTLVQISTQGEMHNRSPLMDEKLLPALNGTNERKIPFVRFYFDGLIVHVHLESEDAPIESETSIFLGTKETIVTCVDYSRSHQYDDMLLLAYESIFGPVPHNPRL